MEKRASMLCKHISSAWKILLHELFCVVPGAGTSAIFPAVVYGFV